MEDIAILIAILIAGMFSVIGILIFKGKTKVKQTKTDANSQLNNVYQDTIVRLQSELKKQVGRANRFQSLYQGSDTEEEPNVTASGGSRGATMEDVELFVKTSYPQYAKYLDNVAIRYYIEDKIQGKTVDELKKEIEPLIRNLKPQGQTKQNELQNSSNYA